MEVGGNLADLRGAAGKLGEVRGNKGKFREC